MNSENKNGLIFWGVLASYVFHPVLLNYQNVSDVIRCMATIFCENRHEVQKWLRSFQ